MTNRVADGAFVTEFAPLYSIKSNMVSNGITFIEFENREGLIQRKMCCNVS